MLTSIFNARPEQIERKTLDNLINNVMYKGTLDMWATNHQEAQAYKLAYIAGIVKENLIPVHVVDFDLTHCVLTDAVGNGLGVNGYATFDDSTRNIIISTSYLTIAFPYAKYSGGFCVGHSYSVKMINDIRYAVFNSGRKALSNTASRHDGRIKMMLRPAHGCEFSDSADLLQFNAYQWAIVMGQPAALAKAIEYIEDPGLDPCELVINHLDNNSMSTDWDNLEYCTSAENYLHGRFVDDVWAQNPGNRLSFLQGTVIEYTKSANKKLTRRTLKRRISAKTVVKIYEMLNNSKSFFDIVLYCLEGQEQGLW